MFKPLRYEVAGHSNLAVESMYFYCSNDVIVISNPKLGMDVCVCVCIALRQAESSVRGALLNVFSYDSGTRKSRKYWIALIYPIAETE
jgi:hypothetical protein